MIKFNFEFCTSKISSTTLSGLFNLILWNFSIYINHKKLNFHKTYKIITIHDAKKFTILKQKTFILQLSFCKIETWLSTISGHFLLVKNSIQFFFKFLNGDFFAVQYGNIDDNHFYDWIMSDTGLNFLASHSSYIGMEVR
jgi:hypothetical protein